MRYLRPASKRAGLPVTLRRDDLRHICDADDEPSSLQISPAFCCGRKSAAICGVCSHRAARRTVKYDCAALRSQTRHITTAFRPRDETWWDLQA